VVTAPGSRPDRATLAAFGGLAVLVGANFVAIRFSNRELAPFWGAGTRFAVAALLFMAILAVRRIAFPRGPALAGAVLFGLLDIAAFFALSYWGLVRVPAGQGALVGALLPLITLFLAVAHGIERLGWRALAGGLLAVAGVALVSGEQVRGDVPLISLLALLAAIVCGAEATILVKWFPPSDPSATNAVAMSVGAVVLLALSVVSGEPRALPVQGATWAAVVYLVSVGTVGVFLLFLFVLKRWQASAVAYLFVLSPFVSVALAAWLLGEGLTPLSAVGAVLVLGGVYVAALAPVHGGASRSSTERR
jgi:drug/metabolite transporter (DMT)-like permease